MSCKCNFLVEYKYFYLHKVLAAGEEAGGEPHQLPASLLGQAVAVLRELPHDLAVNLVTQNLLSITTMR